LTCSALRVIPMPARARENQDERPRVLRDAVDLLLSGLAGWIEHHT